MTFATFLCSGGAAYESASAESLYLGFVMMSQAGAHSLQAYRNISSHTFLL
jgi:hypothetical protein